MVIQYARTGKQSVVLSIIPGQMKTSQFGDSVCRARHIGCVAIWSAEHFAGTGIIETAIWRQIFASRQNMVSAVDIGVKGRKFIVERIAYVTLGGKMVDFIGADGGDPFVNRRKTLERAGQEFDIAQQMLYAIQPVGLILEGYPPDQAIYLVALFQQQFSQIATVLAGDTGDQCLFLPHAILRNEMVTHFAGSVSLRAPLARCAHLLDSSRRIA